MEKGQDSRQRRSDGIWYTGYLIVLIMVTVAGTLVVGSVLVYIQYTKAIQSLPRRIVADHHVYDPDRYFTGRLTFTDRERGQPKDVTQEVFMDDVRREQILHIPGDKVEIYILQKFTEGKQMAVVFHANSTVPEGSVIMCTDTPLEGEYVPNMHKHMTTEVDGDMKITERFQPATRSLEFQYRTCSDIPKDMFSKEVNSSPNSNVTDDSLSRKRRAIPYGNWCGASNGALGLPCCGGCNADYHSCVSPACAPIEDEVDEACFVFKMCEACTKEQHSGLPSCFCVKDFSYDLEMARCRSQMQVPNPPAPVGPGSIADHASAAVDLAASVAGSIPNPGLGAVAVAAAADAAATAAAVDAVAAADAAAASAASHPLDAPAAGVDAKLLAAAEAQAQAELQATIADLKMERILAKGRRKRQVGYFYDRRSCLRYRSKTVTELMHQRCWCPVYIRVQYVCGYQQVAGSCKMTNAGEKCSVKYQTCSKIMSKNTLNAVNYKKCPSIP